MEFLRFDTIYVMMTISLTLMLTFLLRGFISWQNKQLRFSKSFNFNLNFRAYIAKLTLLSMGAFILILALLGPAGDISSLGGTSANVVFLVDTSKSMDAIDSRIGDRSVSRLDKAKSLMSDFVTSHPENNYSIVAFAGEAVTISPLTDDADQILTYISGISTSLIRLGGSDINRALDFSIGQLDKQKSGNIILLSNGFEDSANSFSPGNFTDMPKDISFKVFAIGLGTQDGSYIPSGVDMVGNMTYKSYNGNKVVTRLDKDGLNEIARSFNGRYLNANADSSLDGIDKDLISVTVGLKEIRRRASDVGYHFVLASFVLICAGYLIPYKSRLGKDS